MSTYTKAATEGRVSKHVRQTASQGVASSVYTRRLVKNMNEETHMQLTDIPWIIRQSKIASDNVFQQP